MAPPDRVTQDELSPPAPSPAALVPADGRPAAGGFTSARRDVIRRRDTLFRRSLGVADMCAVAISLVVSVVVIGGDGLTPAALAVPPLFVLMVKALGLYDRDEHLLHKTTLDEIPALFGIATLTALLLVLIDGGLIAGGLDRGQVLGAWLLLFILMICFRSLARALASRVASTERCLLIGDTNAADKLREEFALSHSIRAELVGAIPPTENGSARSHTNGEPHPDLTHVLATQGIDRVILTTGPDLGRDDVLYIIRELKAHGVKVSVLPEASRVAGSSVEIDQLSGLTLLGVRRFEFSRSSRFVKRAFDLFGAASLLAALSPLLLAIAIAVKLDAPGPVLFRQRRVGRHGHEFEMLKFRSMIDGAERQKEVLRPLNEGAAGLFKIALDPRVTRVGRLLRPWQLDELPQLVNVLRGEMSLVGPRPLIPEEDKQIHGWYRRRLDVPPGITGHWQILGSSSRISLEEMVKLDYLYVSNWSLWGDVRLVLRTIPFVFGRRGV